MKKINIGIALGLAVLVGGAQASQAASLLDTSISVGASYDASTGSAAVSNAGATSSVNMAVSGTMPSTLTISVNGDDARSNSNLDTSVSSDAQVQNDASLNTYAEVIAHNDSNVQSVDVNNDQVSMTIDQPAKLFGFIPTTMTEQAVVSVDANGQVQVTTHKPWWAFLASDNSDLLVADIKANLGNSASASGALSAQAKAKILTAIESAAKTFENISVSSSASTSLQAGY
jgi:hypothetical protein